jgi:hypothetical protein
MKALFLLAALLCTMLTAVAAEKDTRLFELRTYYAEPGKLDALHARFRDHTVKLFEKHGITNIGYWVPIENPDRKLLYVLAFPDRAARDASFNAFGADPEWKAARDASEAAGKIVTKIESTFLTTTDFSPAIAPGIAGKERVFELRTYTTVPGKLPALLDRFRNHTTKLFAKHGMTNFYYWQLTPGQPDTDNTFIYLLAHDSAEAGAASFAAFRADPEWIAAKKASEDAAGGSLTIPQPDGVKSLYLKATDYSALR